MNMSRMTNLETLLLYLIKNSPQRSITRIMKLLYLGELYSLISTGKRLSNAKYKYWHHGAYSEDVIDALDKLEKQGLISSKEVITNDDNTATVPIINNPSAVINLTQEKTQILDIVICEWDKVPFNELLEFHKSIYPLTVTEKFKVINMKRYDEVAEIAKTLKISREQAATKLTFEDTELCNLIKLSLDDLEHGRITIENNDRISARTI
jgi:hypothetical protein